MREDIFRKKKRGYAVTLEFFVYLPLQLMKKNIMQHIDFKDFRGGGLPYPSPAVLMYRFQKYAQRHYKTDLYSLSAEQRQRFIHVACSYTPLRPRDIIRMLGITNSTFYRDRDAAAFYAKGKSPKDRRFNDECERIYRYIFYMV